MKKVVPVKNIYTVIFMMIDERMNILNLIKAALS